MGPRPALITPQSAAAHVFVASLDTPALEPDDRHHLERVLRLRSGSTITVSDGRGSWRPALLGPELSPLGAVVVEPMPAPALTVAFALVKGERPELVVRALTEIGVDRLVPLHTARTVVRWDGSRRAGALERLRRVARSAGMQCRRVWLPQVEGVATFGEVAGAPGTALAVPGGAVRPGPDHPTVLVGPEGGWAPEELATGLPHVALGPHVLRTETAAIVAGALLVAARARGS